ncbi:MAG: mammalian cell entry protein [Burkholderiales bacterium PBB4]|nr:MAG: mammalian cell entry protein [Burkholderiales bacterium PBB4]
MQSPPPPESSETPAAMPADVAHLDFKAKLLLAGMALLLIGSVLFVMYARGAFDATQRLVLMAEDSEGVVVGMDLTFSGFPIGRVQHIELAEDGKARILVDVAAKDAHWLRSSSVFTLVKGIVGAPAIRAYSGIPGDPPLPPGAVRTVLQGDASAEIPKVIAAAKDLIENLTALTEREGPAGAVLAQLQTTTERLNGPGGAMTVLLGSEAEAKKMALALERTNQLLARLDGLAAKADTQVFGAQGVMPKTQATVEQLNALLAEARTSLQKVDGALKDAQAVSANAKEASADLGTLRAEVDASLRKVQGLITEINRKWPFARDSEIRLP